MITDKMLRAAQDGWEAAEMDGVDDFDALWMAALKAAEAAAWEPIETAPFDEEVDIATSSGLVTSGWKPKLRNYAWWQTRTGSIPVAETHAPESLSNCSLATHWRPRPTPPA